MPQQLHQQNLTKLCHDSRKTMSWFIETSDVTSLQMSFLRYQIRGLRTVAPGQHYPRKTLSDVIEATGYYIYIT